MTSVLSLDSLHSGYGGIEVLRGVNLDIKKGEIYALIGKNGAGKTTLLQTVLGVISATKGTVNFRNRDITGLATNEIIQAGIACAPQERPFFSELSVEENLRLGSLGLSRAAFVSGRDRVIAMFPFIGERLRQPAGTLSGGEQAMVKVARALLPQPELVLLDEVTEGLQPLTVDRVRSVLQQDHAERATTMLVVEQNVDFVASFAMKYGLMERGEIIGDGAFSETRALEVITRHLSV